MSDIQQVVEKSAQDHLRLAAIYESGGNTQGAMYLRYVSGLLYAIARGDEPHTILPWPERCPTCDSPRPELHPAMQCEGEVQPCKNEWHSRR